MVNVQKVKNSLLNIDDVEEVESMPRGKRNNVPVRFGVKEAILEESLVSSAISLDFVLMHNREGYNTVIDVYNSFGRLENYKGDVLDVVIDEGDFLVCEVSEGNSAIKGALVRIDKDNIDENNYKVIDL